MPQIRKIIFFTSLALLALTFTFGTALLFGSPEFGWDGWQYVSSGKSILTGTMPENYFWVRQPLWPLLLAVPIHFGANIWSIVLLSCFLVSLGWVVFVLTVRRHIAPELSAKLYWLCASIPAIGLWFYLGGYVMTPLQQAALVGYLMLLTSLCIKTFSVGLRSDSIQRRTVYVSAWFVITAAGYLLTTAYGAIAVVSAFVVGVLGLSESRGSKTKVITLFLPSALIVLGSFVGLLVSHVAWSSVVENATTSENFNEENLQDPFWEIDYLGNIKKRVDERTTYYAQEVFVSIFSLLDVTQSRGWRGIDNNPFRDDEVNINFAIGSRPFTDVAPVCSEPRPWIFSQSTPDAMPALTKILTVDPQFISDFKDSPQCKLTGYTLPQWFSLLGWVFWILLLSSAIFDLIRRPTRLKIALYAPPILLILVYGITGGAIARYGIPAYYPIALMGALAWINLFTRRRKQSHQDAANFDSVT